MLVVQLPGPDELEQARQQGGVDALAAVEQYAPADPMLRVAWAIGFGQHDLVRAAVAVARAGGATWEQIAVLVGASDRRTAEARYGAGRERKRAYRARRRGEEQG